MTHSIRLTDAGQPASIASAGRGLSRFTDDVTGGQEGLDPSGPLIPDDDAAGTDIFTDSGDPAQRWYVPVVSVVMPEPDDDPATAAFRYTFVTRPDQTISATVVVTIETAAPPGAQPTWLPIPLTGLTAVLGIPYRSEADGTMLHVTPGISGTIQAVGGNRFTISFQLPGDFVARAAYGNFSVPGFQDEPARIRLAFAVDGYAQILFGIPDDVSGFRAIEVEPLDLPDLPVEPHPPGPEPDPSQPANTGEGIITTVVTQPLVNDAAITVNLSADLTQPAGTDVTAVVAKPLVRFAPDQAPVTARDFAARMPVALARRIGTDDGEPQGPTIATDPPDSAFLVPRQVLRMATVDLSFPCSRLGGLYRSVRTDGTSAQVGCQEAMALGRGPAAVYEPVPEADAQFDGRLTVFRALQQPGLFMVVPAQYLIGRVGAPAGGYQPAALWVQSFDAGTEAPMPVTFHAELSPALTGADWLRLRATLDATSPNHISRPLLATDPALGLLLESATVSWGPDGIATTVVPDGTGGLRITAAMAYDQAAIVLATMIGTGGLDGIVGSARFSTGDATTEVATALRLTPHELAGPAPQGAVAAVTDGSTATLTNRDDAAAKLRSVLVLDALGAVHTIPRGDTLPAGGTLTVDIGAAGAVAVAAEYDLQPDAAVFAQRNVYVEDMHALVVVLNDVWPGSAGSIQSIDLAATGAGAAAEVPVTAAVPRVELTVVRPLNTADVAQARRLTLVATAHRTDGSVTTSGPYVVDVSQTVLVELSKVLAAPPAG
jgi:hypothetical protein